MKTTYLSLNQDLSIQIIKNENLNENVIYTPIKNNQIFIFDFSGSMYGIIEKMATDVCNKISELSLNDLNTFTFIWFSSENSYGTIVEEYHIDTIQQLENLKQLIKKNFITIGCTSFSNPIKVAYELASKFKKDMTSVSLWFLSDGQHNDGSVSKVYEYCEKISPYIDSALFIEYGNYCDRKMMSEMASYMNGELICSSDFKTYQQSFDRFVKRQIKTVKKINLKIEKSKFSSVCVQYEDSIISAKITNDEVNVNEDFKYVLYTKIENNKTDFDGDNTILYKYASNLAILGNKNYAKLIFKNIF
jgi:hypothetical protein